VAQEIAPAALEPTLPGSPPLPAPAADVAGAAAVREMQRTLKELQVAVERLTRQGQETQLAGQAPLIRTIHQHLISREVEPTLVLELVGQLAEEVGPACWLDETLVQGRLGELLEERIPVAALEARSGRPHVVMLVGPTGVGKTTTVAKLAAHLALAQGKKVSLATTDTVRVAATGQLGTYAAIMDLPLDVVYTPADLAAALMARSDRDFILVDTPGCAPGNEPQIREAAAFAAAAAGATVLLTVAAPTTYRDLQAIRQGFGALPLCGLVLTKLDETQVPGQALSLVARQGTPLYFTTAGQHVPDDIQAASSSRLAGLLTAGCSWPRSARVAEAVAGAREGS
jgi:flagellar biosynthesis protein FlhF